MLVIVQLGHPAWQSSPLSGSVHNAGAVAVQLGGGHLLHGQLGLLTHLVQFLACPGVPLGGGALPSCVV